MFAVVQAGGRQIRVAPSDIVKIDRIEAEAGAEVSIGRVLLLRTGDRTHIGTPTVEGAEVRGEVLGQERGKKIRVFFYRRRKNSKKTRGHRQSYTAVRVRSLVLNGEVVAEAEAKKAAAAPKAQAPAQEPAAPEVEAQAAAPEAETQATAPEAENAPAEAQAAAPEAEGEKA